MKKIKPQEMDKLKMTYGDSEKNLSMLEDKLQLKKVRSVNSLKATA